MCRTHFQRLVFDWGLVPQGDVQPRYKIVASLPLGYTRSTFQADCTEGFRNSQEGMLWMAQLS